MPLFWLEERALVLLTEDQRRRIDLVHNAMTCLHIQCIAEYTCSIYVAEK